jgi:anaerobic selenocysteine-containing dehydrogenase
MAVATRKTFCRLCHAACPIEVDIDDSANRIVAVRGDRDDPLFEGYTCIKGRQMADQHHHPDRLRQVLRRTPDGRFEPVASQTGFDEVAAQIAAIVAEHGPRAVASYTGTGGFQNSTSVEVARAWHSGFDSPSFYTSVTIDQPAKFTGNVRMGIWEAGFHNFRDADVVLALGYNPLVSSYGAVGGLQGTNPFTVIRRAKDRGLKLIVVDPRRTELATFADIHLQIRPGEDPTLLAGLLNVVVTEGLHNAGFCESYTDGLAELATAVRPFTPEYVARRCELEETDVVAAARLFAAGPRGTAGTGTGPNMAPHPNLSEHLTLALNIVCGRVNRVGDELESPLFLAPKTPRRAQVIPPRAPNVGTAHRVRGLKSHRGEMLTNSLADEILEPGEGQVRALIVSGGNPVVAWPDQQKTAQAMAELDLLIVMDHRFTATAEFADYIFPPRLALERADVPHIMDRWFAQPYSNYTPAVLDTDDDTIAEWELFWEIASRNGTPIELRGGEMPANQKPTDDDVLDLVYANSRMPLDEIRSSRGVIHPEAAMVVEAADPTATGRFALSADGIVEELAEVAEESTGADRFSGFDPDAYPFRLISRRLKARLNSLGGELPALAAKGTTNFAYMNPADLASIEAQSGDLVEITSPHASVVGVAESSDDLKRGVISMAHSWGGSGDSDEKVRDIGTPTNRLVSNSNGFEPITGMAVQSAIPVQVRRAQTNGANT